MSLTCHPDTAFGELKSEDHSFPLYAVDVKGRVKGLLYGATVTQSFRNDRDSRMEAVYTFPLPPRAAVHNFTITIGDRVIEGTVKERQQARQEYQEAVAQGHRAALMEEERSDIFTTTVGNIGPGEQVVVRFEMSGPLNCHRTRARLRFPLVVGEVYIPGKSRPGRSQGSGTACDTDQVPDASRITPPRLAPGARNPVKLTLSLEVDTTLLQVCKVESTCHFARIVKNDGTTTVSLLPGMERLDRAFILDITYPEDQLQTSLQVDKESGAFALTVIPPVAKIAPRPRDLVIVLDRSGSMGGWPVIAARQAAARIIEGLNAEDRFGLIAYDTSFEHLDPQKTLRHAKQFYKMQSSEFLNKIDARGGTQTSKAIQEAFEYLQVLAERDLHIILLTDGHVGNDDTLMRLAQQNVRISTVGIGEATRDGLLERMATASGGICTLIPNHADLEEELLELHRTWGEPEWQDLSLTGVQRKSASPKFWDVWEHVPTTFFGILAKRGRSKAKTLSSLLPDGHPYKVKLNPHISEEPLFYRAWARAKLLELEDAFALGEVEAQDMVKLSVKAQVLCRFTAFSAIDQESKVDTNLELQEVMQPVERSQASSGFAFNAIAHTGIPGFGGFSAANHAAILRQQVSDQQQAQNIMVQIGAEHRKSQMLQKSFTVTGADQVKSHSTSPPGDWKNSLVGPDGRIDRSLLARLKSMVAESPAQALLKLLERDSFDSTKLTKKVLSKLLKTVDEMVELCGEMARSNIQVSQLRVVMQMILNYQMALQALLENPGGSTTAVKDRRDVLYSFLTLRKEAV